MLPNVFGVGRAALEPLAAEVAALLYVGDDCVLSHATAAALWGFAARPDDLIEVTLIGRNVRQRPGLRVYRVAELDVRDVRIRDGIPVTSPARTLIDLAARARDDELHAAISEARVLRLITDPELDQALDRCLTRSGSARLRNALKQQTGRLKTRRAAERRLLGLLSKAGLPTPETNVRIGGFEVDFVWRAQGLIVETDGYMYHSHRAAFERDRARDQLLVAAGFRVIRVTWRQLEREPLAVVARIAQALALTAGTRS